MVVLNLFVNVIICIILSIPNCSKLNIHYTKKLRIFVNMWIYILNLRLIHKTSRKSQIIVNFFCVV